MASDRPIFVMGCPRSGTTMLRLMLHTHPRLAIPPRNRFLLEAYRERRRFGDLRRTANRRALAAFIVDRRESTFADLGLDPVAVRTAIVAGPAALGPAFAVVFRAYAERFGKPRWGDRRPAYVNNLHILLRLFPDAQLVNIVRDGRDCVASLQQTRWHREGIYQSIAAWAQAVDNARLARLRLPADSFYELRYEELVADPARELAALCEFLGERYEPAMLDAVTLTPTAVAGGTAQHERPGCPVTGERVGMWRHRLSRPEITLCETLLADRLRERGYEVSGTDRIRAADRLRYERIAARHRLTAPRRALARASDRLRRLPPIAVLPAPRQREAWVDKLAGGINAPI